MTALGVEYGCKYVLVGPDGTRAVFNDSTDLDFVGMLSPESSGLDSAEVREDAQDSTEADGGVHGNFWYGRRPVILQGTVIATTKIDRNAKVAKIKRATNAMRGDATLTWQPAGGPEVSLKLRRQQPVRFTKGFVKDFILPMVSAMAEIFSVEISEQGEEFSPPEEVSVVKFPGAQLNDNTGYPEGVRAWSGSPGALLSDNTYAFSTLKTGEITQYLRVRNLGFSIPTSATILGVKVEVERHKETVPAISGGTNMVDNSVRLRKSSGFVGTNKKSATQWPFTIDVVETYGGNSDLWGTTLTPAEVNSSEFGVGVSVISSGPTETTAYVDVIKITVSYKNGFEMHSQTIESFGTEPTGDLIEIAGPTISPFSIENKTTGQKMVFTPALLAGEVMQINLQDHTIFVNGANKYSMLDLSKSSWITIDPGENEFVFPASAGAVVTLRDAWI